VRVGVIQSNYLPWRGYFDFIDDVDLFVFHDDLQYTKGDWRNRNRIKRPSGTAWITVPVEAGPTARRISETRVCRGSGWEEEHLRRIRESYRGMPGLPDVLSILREAFARREETVSALNIRLIAALCEYLGVRTPTEMSERFRPEGAKTERLVGILRRAGATAYLSGPTARGYLEEERFAEAGIRLEYKTYDYPPYPQPWGAFDGAVSVVDLIACTGREARRYLKSRTPAEVAVP
jgi:hypothetical protein